MRGFDPQRLVLVKVEATDNSRRVGTGYAVVQDGGLILTAKHVWQGRDGEAPPMSAEVRFIGEDEGWQKASLCWRATTAADACLLRCKTRRPFSSDLRWGRYNRSHPVVWQSCGFPRVAGITKGDDITLRDTAEVRGAIEPKAWLRRRLFELTVEAAPRIPGDWKGLSGAPVFSEGRLVAIVRSTTQVWRDDRLQATPADDLFADQEFWRLVGSPEVDDVPRSILSKNVQALSRPWFEHHRSLGRLLNARYCVVPFFDELRQAELEQAASWCEHDQRLGFALVTGQGGTGKTRLFMRECARLRGEEGWRAGFLPDGSLAGDGLGELDDLCHSSMRTLVVIDYAETRHDLRSFLKELVRREDDVVGRVRVALLAREAADWWRYLQGGGDRLSDLLGEWVCPHIALGAVALEEGLRRAAYDQSYEAFAKVLGRAEATEAPTVDLSDERYGRVLYLHMAALSSIEGIDFTAESLVDAVLDREAGLWTAWRNDQRNDQEARLFDAAARRSMAAITLWGGVSGEVEAVAALQSAGIAGKDAGLFADWLHQFYPGAEGGGGLRIGPLEPDVLGERLVEGILTDQHTASDFLEQVLIDASDETLRRCFTVLGRIAVERSRGVQSWIRDLLLANTDRYAEPAFEASLAVGAFSGFSVLGDLLTEALEQSGTVEIARQIEAKIPRGTVSLRSLAAWANEKALEGIPGSSEDETIIADRARVLNNLGKRYSDLGRREQALQATEEAAEIRRKLAAARPDAFLPDLATSLNNLGARYSDLGRREQALQATEEAAEIRRELAAARPDAFLPDLAASLNNLGIHHGALGKREQALQATEEAAGIYRKLAAARPDAFLPDLAMSLHNLGVRCGALGKREEALQATEEAAGIYRKLAAARPDAFVPDLAASLTNLGIQYDALGKREEALQATEEAVEIRRKLASARPEAFLPGLAGSLDSLGIMCSALGKREQALQATEEAVEIRRKLTAARPDAFLPNLAGSLHSLGVRYGALGKREEALQATEEAVEIRRKLASARPEAFLPGLAGSVNNLGAMYTDLGKREEALQATEEAAGIYRKLAAARPDAFLPNLAGSLDNLGISYSALGKREEALQAAEEAAGFYRELAAARPDAFLPNLASSLNNLGVMYRDLGKREEALQANEEAAEICRELAAARPEVFLPDLASSLNNLGVMYRGLGKREQAVQATQEAVEIRRKLAAARPDAFLPDLASSLNNLGIVSGELGRQEQAAQAGEEAVGILRKQAAVRPDMLLRHLGASLDSLGNTYSKLGQREQALQAAEEAVGIFRKLAAAQPGAVLQDLAECLDSLSNSYGKLGQREQALQAAKEAVEVRQEFAALERHGPG